MLKKLLPLVLMLAFASQAVADEADIKKAMEAKLGTKIESVTKSGYLGLYEVYADGNILYTDEKMTAFIAGGQLIEGKSMKNVTEERMRKLTAIRFGDLPFERAIKQVRGDGKRVLATFEDPNCGYCKRLAKDLQKLDNVTIYTFLLPILSEDSIRKSKQIWCSADRAKTWNDWMLDGKAPAGRDDCDTSAVSKNQEFGRKLSISGTPTMFFGDGERVPGAMPLARIEQRLSQVK
ncbi:DsbC family protein [Dechloromonas denitrificans]|uniref:DsbC family protein n=1 Tax=Dechloromonas denitrificans TaxID=281362 RepID=UPI001CF81951|nr:DsbC family protein [Dechloromonas denitrificans]UCV04320.1 DsbC family protein [Dechloromonas denitrificans]UCV08648.1 DsbC family protein [Dechloromonas denitrificans]